MGHEGTGEVVSVGEGVTHVTPGDRIITSIVRRDGDPTGEATPTSASSVAWHGEELDGHQGSIYTWAEHALLDADYVVKVPSDTPSDVVAPLGCGVLTGAGTVTNALDVQAGRSCAVYGVGGVGLSTGEMVLGQKTLLGVMVGSAVPERDVLEILRWHREGMFDLDELVTERHTLDEINEATGRLERGEVFGRSIVVF